MSWSRDDIGVWLISLERDADRRAAMAAQLDRLGLSYTWFQAVDGRARQAELMERADSAAYARNMGSPILPGKLGCYASHVAVWEELTVSGHKAALIFEDDVVFHDDFLDALDLALSRDAVWDIIRFNCIRAKIPLTQLRDGQYRFNAYIGPFTGNAAYLVKREVASRLLPNLWPQTRAFDHELNRFFVHNYRQVGLEPWPSHVDDGGVSSITGANHSLVRKPHWTKRIPHYRLKAANYLRRAVWLLGNRRRFRP